jgi:hypothetical protein
MTVTKDGAAVLYVHPILALIALGMLVALFVTHFHTYPVGAYLDLPLGHWVGWELAPTFGPFWDVT